MSIISRETVRHVAIATVLVVLGWAAGRAQMSEPAFELVVDSPPGETTIHCVRGCNLAWVERGIIPNSAPQPGFTYACTGATVTRCSSSRVGGWLTP
jgi:hypothetical protein